MPPRIAPAGVANLPEVAEIYAATVRTPAFREVGVKLGRARDVRWYQRPLRP